MASGAVAENPPPASAEKAAQAPQAQAPETPQAQAASEEEFQTIWTRKVGPSTGLAHGSSEDLYLTRIGLNAANVAFDLKSESRDHDSPKRGRSEVPELDVSVDGCPGPAIKLPKVQLAYDGPAARLIVARDALPQGDLLLSFRAFDNEYSMLFANDASGFRSITMEEMKGYHLRPGTNGEPDTVSIPVPNCSDKGR